MFAGVDVAKAELVVACRPTGTGWTATNDPAGVATTVARLQALSPALLVVEATGGYARALVAALAAAALPVVVVNPRQVRDCAKGTGQLAKTDRLDADVLALFAERVRPTPRALPEPIVHALDAWLTRRRQWLDMLTAERHRREHARRPFDEVWANTCAGSNGASRMSIGIWPRRLRTAPSGARKRIGGAACPAWVPW
jgi:transposase